MTKTSGKINKQKEIEKKKRKKRKKMLITFLIILILAGISTYLLTSDNFDIQQISIKGNKQLSNQEITELAGLKIGDNIFSKIGIITRVKLKENGYIKNAKISKKLPNRIEIEIEERTRDFQIKVEDGYIYIDEQGYLLEYSVDKLEIPTITGIEVTSNDLNNQNRLNEKCLDKMENILQIREQCKNIGILEKITEYQVEDGYIVILENGKKTINFGDASNLKSKIYYVNGILKQEGDNNGTIYVNGNLNDGFSAYFSAQ